MKYESLKDEMFDSIYRSYAEEIYHAVYYMTKDSELSYDITHQAFLNFYKRFDEVEINPACYKHYVMKSALNLAKNYFRSVEKETFIETEISNDKVSCPGFVVESMEETYFREQYKEMRENLSDLILEDLKENHKNWYNVVFKMFYEEKDHDEIAEELGITKEVLYSRLYRAKNWIKAHYDLQFKELE